MYTRILIANRGEIAVRIIRACKEMGVETVAVYSEADADSLHAALADQSICIGPAQAAGSYLNAEAIISAAMISGAAAIHPGYGFLSENAEFAELCEKNGIDLIGPGARIMRLLGDKTGSKAVMQKAGLPVIPGTGALKSLNDAILQAERIGYPVMLKSRSGGGGRGIRVIHDDIELQKSYAEAEAEALAAFGDGSLYLEKYIFPARHIEVQILADEEGHVLFLGERDCSVQRRHQKLIEESPSPAVKDSDRSQLARWARKAVKATSYVGVGTLEFLLDPDGKFWFMEMNVRLQVEHGVTEMLTNVDLVKWQIRTAAGVPVGMQQKEISLNGACMECRINALSTGIITMLHVPGGPFVRFDTCLMQGLEITPFYDSLLGKLIVYAGTREEAVRKMKAALCELTIEGVETNIEEQLKFVSRPDFGDGGYDLRFIR